jgi:hypothetical protein
MVPRSVLLAQEPAVAARVELERLVARDALVDEPPIDRCLHACVVIDRLARALNPVSA